MNTRNDILASRSDRIRIRSLLRAVASATLALAATAAALADAPRWEIPIGTTFVCGDTAVVNAVLVKFDPIVECATRQQFCGSAQVVAGGLPCNVGNRLNVNNIAVRFEFLASSGPENGLLMRFGQFGGFKNISINGSQRVCFNEMGQLDGQTLGGVSMQVINGFGNGCGQIQFFGTVNQLVIAGQEFWIDGLCQGQPRDINSDGLVNAEDLAMLLNAWGTNVEYADFNCDEKVDAVDLAELLNAWS